MNKAFFLTLCFPLVCFAFTGCGTETGGTVTTDKTELEKYLAEHPESANAEMDVLEGE